MGTLRAEWAASAAKAGDPIERKEWEQLSDAEQRDVEAALNTRGLQISAAGQNLVVRPTLEARRS